MPNRKVFVHGEVVESCFRAEEGLPLGPKPYMRVIIESILARAQTLYPVQICHYVVMGNHIHMMFVVIDPKDPPSFLGYIKREVAHAVNRLLGRRKHTVWADDYDSPKILDPAKLPERIAYIYLNPSRAGLVNSIEEYPNISSWGALLAGGVTIKRPGIARDAIPRLPKRTLSLAEEHALAKELLAEGGGSYTLRIEPFACFAAFNASRDADPAQLISSIVKEVKSQEESNKRARGKPVVGEHALRLQPLTVAHQPKKWGRRMLCLSSSRALRAAYIQWYRWLVKNAEAAKGAYFDGTYCVPPGLFAPGGYVSGSIFPPTVPNANTVMI